jgi:hypothetical protein
MTGAERFLTFQTFELSSAAGLGSTVCESLIILLAYECLTYDTSICCNLSDNQVCRDRLTPNETARYRYAGGNMDIAEVR